MVARFVSSRENDGPWVLNLRGGEPTSKGKAATCKSGKLAIWTGYGLGCALDDEPKKKKRAAEEVNENARKKKGAWRDRERL